MPTYVVLSNYTDEGIQAIRDSPRRREAVMERAREFGVTLRDRFVTMGQYDVVTIWDAPDDETMAKFRLATAQHAKVRSQTLRAFSSEEVDRIIDGIGPHGQ